MKKQIVLILFLSIFLMTLVSGKEYGREDFKYDENGNPYVEFTVLADKPFNWTPILVIIGIIIVILLIILIFKDKGKKKHKK